ncbi:MAG: STAS domain-containing protein [Lachnospiraceae bacterium]|nr:STAS domain-containing protein [Lachnospiraceae bacterium]
MNIIATDCESYMRLIVDGRVDTNTSPQLQQAVLSAFQKKKDVVVDFLNVPYISSAGLRALLIGQKTAASKGGSMKLTNVSEIVMNILDMSGFSKILQIE